MDGNQNSALLDRWVGDTIFLRQLGGEKIDAADMDAVVANPDGLSSIDLKETASFVIFEGYD